MFGPYPRQTRNVPLLNPFGSADRSKTLDEHINEGEALIGDLRDRLSLYIHKCARVRDVEDDLASYFQNMSSNLINSQVVSNVSAETEHSFKTSLSKCSMHLNALADYEDFKAQRIQIRVSKIFEIYYDSLQRFRNQSVGLNKFHLPQSLINLGRDISERNTNLYQGNMMNPYGPNPNFYPQPPRGIFGSGDNKPWNKNLGTNRMFMSQENLAGRFGTNIQNKNVYAAEKMRIDCIKEMLCEFFATELFCCIKQLETLTAAYKDIKSMTDAPDFDDANVKSQLQDRQVPNIKIHDSSLTQDKIGSMSNLSNNSIPFQQRQPFMPPSMFNGYKNYSPGSPYYFPMTPNPMMGGARNLGYMGGIMDEFMTTRPPPNLNNNMGIGGYMTGVPTPGAQPKSSQRVKNVSFDASTKKKLDENPIIDQKDPALSRDTRSSTLAESNNDYSTTDSDESESSSKK